jgi:hypothetical protein
MLLDKSELVTELKMGKDIARKFSYIGIDNIKNLSESKAKDINRELTHEINESLPKSTNNGYIDKAKNT